jgi:hypothetical protein
MELRNFDDPAQIKSQELSKFGVFYNPIPEIIAQTTEFFSWPIYELPVFETLVEGKGDLGWRCGPCPSAG